MRRRLATLLCLALLAACTPPLREFSTPRDPWAQALRALDARQASHPAQDITAVYLRLAENTLQVRVDLLDFQSAKELSLDITLADAAAPESAPLSIHIPSPDNPFRTHLDPLLATVVVDVPLPAAPSRPLVDVSTREETLTGLQPGGAVPAQTAPVLLAFYDTFAGRFPAEALRRWDGAHSGPRGERHGLKHLLDAAAQYGLPLVLLDLKEAENLSALDALGALARIQQLEQQGLLILPDQAGHEALFGFPPSPFQWGDIPGQGALPPRPTFVFLSDPNHIYRPLLGKTTFLPVASQNEASQPTRDGPSLEVRRALLETASNADGKDLLVLGGSLRDSTWGSPDMLAPTLAYFASRPYVRLLSAVDLVDFPTVRGRPEVRAFPADDSRRQLQAHYQKLTRPVLEFAASWKGASLASCETDIDRDHQPECVLANEEYLAILDPQGARLTYLFAVERDNISLSLQQLIGPSWQVAVGLSNPSLWDLSAGEAADPGANPGAFTDDGDPFKLYEPAIQANRVTMTSADGARAKTFTLGENGLQVEYRTQEPVSTQIPLLVEPEARFHPGWAQRYVQKKTPGGVAWGLENGPMLGIQAQGAIVLRAFNESLSLLAGPEDPDFGYPPGHYLPFPMAIAQAEMQDGYFLRLERLP